MRSLYLLEKNTQTKHQNFTQYSKQMQKLTEDTLIHSNVWTVMTLINPC